MGRCVGIVAVYHHVGHCGNASRQTCHGGALHARAGGHGSVGGTVRALRGVYRDGVGSGRCQHAPVALGSIAVWRHYGDKRTGAYLL